MGQEVLCCTQRVHRWDSIAMFSGFPEGTQTDGLVISLGREGETFGETIAAVYLSCRPDR